MAFQYEILILRHVAIHYHARSLSGKQIICDDKTFYMIQRDDAVLVLFMDGTTVYKIQSTYDEAMTEQIIQTIQ